MFAIICYLYVSTGKSIQNFIPLISLIVVSAVRVIPSLSLISVSVTNIKFQQPSFNLIYNELLPQNQNTNKHKKDKKLIHFKKEILLKNVSYRYPGTSNDVLKEINLKINFGEKIGITGESGAGKSTFLDILSGLIKPTSGQVIIDQTQLENGSWGYNLGYVPQDIYLLDDTVKSNIAFGEDSKDFNEDRFFNSLKISNLSEFVNKLDEKRKNFYWR